MKKIIKKNYKIILGIIIGVIISGLGAYAATTLSSSDITYDNSKSGLTSTNLNGAIDELYEKVNSKPCKVIKGTGKEILDEIACGTEEFYVLNSLGDSIRTITKYPIEQGIVGTTEISNPSYLQREYCNEGYSCVIPIYNGSVDSGVSKYYTILQERIGLSKGVAVEDVSIEYLNKSLCSYEIEYNSNGKINKVTGSCPNASKVTGEKGVFYVREGLASNQQEGSILEGATGGNMAFGKTGVYHESYYFPIRAIVTIPRIDIGY